MRERESEKKRGNNKCIKMVSIKNPRKKDGKHKIKRGLLLFHGPKSLWNISNHKLRKRQCQGGQWIKENSQSIRQPMRAVHELKKNGVLFSIFLFILSFTKYSNIINILYIFSFYGIEEPKKKKKLT